MPQRVAEVGRFEGRELRGGAAARIDAARRELVRAARERRRRHDDHLLGPRGRGFLEQPCQRARTIADAVDFPFPRTLRRELEQVRIGGYWNRQARRKRVDEMVAAGAGKINRFGGAAAVAAARPKNRWRCP